MRKNVVAFGCLVLVGSFAVAQITITHSELPSQIGDTVWFKYNDGEVNVSVGSPGGPHTWDFDTAGYAGWVDERSIVDIGGTPFPQYFPDANVCFYDHVDSMEMYFYHGLTPSEYRTYGQGWVASETSFANVYNPTCLSLQLPLTMGTNWESRFGWTDTIADSMMSVIDNWAVQRVDAWGTAQTPAGNFPCLRVNSVRMFIIAMLINGTPVYADTTWDRSYYWFAERVGWVATAGSMMNDTTVNFTQSDCYTILVDEDAGAIAEERQAVRLDNGLPTVVRGMLRVPDGSRLDLLDLSGRKVMDLVPGRNDLSAVAPGVYFCRPTAGSASPSPMAGSASCVQKVVVTR